jgi:5-(carboxyamino)imidazole ribonucleotide synthase
MQERITDTRIGILGGGQLGRMIIQSAVDFNLDISILDPDPEAPCKNLTANFKVGKLTDFDTVYEFGQACDLITIEIENVNVDALAKLQNEGKKVYPQPEIIRLIQNKVDQKLFYKEHGIPTAPFEIVENAETVYQLKHKLPFVNKLATEGYDGRGVQVIRQESDLKKAFDKRGLIEDLIDFDKEISVIVARNESGKVKSFPVVELVFHPEYNLVEYLFSPARITEEIEKKAEDIAIKTIEELNMVGLLAVEMFVTKEGNILVNEMAPRPHNSGHQSIEGNITSQFEQHLRAILNMPLGDTSIKSHSAMVNLLGEIDFSGVAYYEGLEEVLAMQGTHIHLYGKLLTKPFRKMGHVTITGSDFDSLEEKARFVKNKLKIKA